MALLSTAHAQQPNCQDPEGAFETYYCVSEARARSRAMSSVTDELRCWRAAALANAEQQELRARVEELEAELEELKEKAAKAEVEFEPEERE